MKVIYLLFGYGILTTMVLHWSISVLESEHGKCRITGFHELRNEMNAERSGTVLVIAHRGDWRNAPENSLQAVRNCIALGVDIVEIDIQRTRDDHLILMHDETLDRTTTGSGRVTDWTLDSLKQLRLRNGLGRPTHHTIPTLEEVLLAAKGRILINLDKCYDYFDEAYRVAMRTGTVDQILIKGKYPLEKVRKDFGRYLDEVAFMPVVDLNAPGASQIVMDYQKNLHPVAFEFIFEKDTSSVLRDLAKIKRRGAMIWVNSLWASLNGGWEDDMAVQDPDSIYGWYVDKGVNMIQTDRPRLLLDYLRKRGLHD